MAEIIAAVFQENKIAVVQGDKDIAIQLLQLPFNHIFFTGSSAVGKIIMKAAAEHHASVTLELGGKTPVIIDASADLNDAARKIGMGKFLNFGQACVSPDYLLVHQSKLDELVEKLKSAIQKSYGTGEQIKNSPDLARIINTNHFNRLKSMLDEAIRKGAEIKAGGEADEENLYIAPTILTNVPDDCQLMQEEIFGPILPIISFATIDEALEIVNNKPKPLAMYIFSKTHENIEKILNETSAGGTTVNDFGMHYIQYFLPFGGVGMSGFGSSHGKNGFLAFSHSRAIVYHHKWSPLKLFAPPYKKIKNNMTRLLIKYL
ncbi:MAG: aldehyde dehydrogenase family protein [Calditrichaeota bacterium]|nr:MAG: aldehyde dehydrogenase family protein [Calditrichota bacterium]